jgi:hypothetical protein
VAALLDQLSLTTVSEICLKLRLPVNHKSLTPEELRMAQQEALETEIKKKGHTSFLTRITAKTLRSICTDVSSFPFFFQIFKIFF